MIPNSILYACLTVIRSARPYLWIAIACNSLGMAVMFGAKPAVGLAIGCALSFTASFGFLVNDIWDRDADRLNAANRLENATPPAMRLAFGAAIAFLSLAVISSCSIGADAVLATGGLAVALVLYTVILRKVVFISTLVCAACVSSPYWFPAIALSGEGPRGWAGITISAALFVLAREIVLDAKDETGDSRCGKRTLPTAFGKKIALRVMIAITALASIVFCGTLGLTGLSGSPQLGICAVAVAGLISSYTLLLSWRLVREPHGSKLHAYIAGTRRAMLIFILPLIMINGF